MTSSWSKEHFKSDKILKILKIFGKFLTFLWEIFSLLGKFSHFLENLGKFCIFSKILHFLENLEKICIFENLGKICNFWKFCIFWKKFFQNFAMFKMLCTRVLWYFVWNFEFFQGLQFTFLYSKRMVLTCNML